MSHKCSHIQKQKDKFYYIYFPCDRKVIAKVEFRSAIDGKEEANYVCKMHLNSTIKWANRVKNRMGYDIELKINDI